MRPGRGRRAAVEPILMKTPPPCERICGTKAWAVSRIDFTLTANTRSNSASSISISGLLRWVVPALLTTMSTRPKASIARPGRALDVGAFRHVGVKRDRLAAEPLRGRLGDIALQVEAGDARALARENFRDAEPETLPRAGHQRRLALQSHIHPLPRRNLARLSSLAALESAGRRSRALSPPPACR